MADALVEEEDISEIFLIVNFIGYREMLDVQVSNELRKELVVQVPLFRNPSALILQRI